MATKRKLDNIERDVIRAMELGYGVHYGNYKADHPFTKYDPEPVPMVESKPCLHCGAPILLHNGNDRRKRFRKDDCREGYKSRQKFLKGG